MLVAAGNDEAGEPSPPHLGAQRRQASAAIAGNRCHALPLLRQQRQQRSPSGRRELVCDQRHPGVGLEADRRRRDSGHEIAQIRRADPYSALQQQGLHAALVAAVMPGHTAFLPCAPARLLAPSYERVSVVTRPPCGDRFAALQ
jgi:hypothetical protein